MSDKASIPTAGRHTTLQRAKLLAKRRMRLAQLAYLDARRGYLQADLALIDAEAGGLADVAAVEPPAVLTRPSGAGMVYRIEWKFPTGRLTPEGEDAAFRAFAEGMRPADVSRIFRITRKAAGAVRERWVRFVGAGGPGA